MELLVNCAECGSLLKAELCNHDERPFSNQILITVARCDCEPQQESPELALIGMTQEETIEVAQAYDAAQL